MAVLHVDEVEARPLRQHGCAHEVVHETVELRVAQDLHTAREAAVEERMVPRSQRLRAIPGGRPRVAARVGELQADHEALVRAAARAMGRHQLLAQARDLFPGRVADHELRGVAAPVGTHGRRLAAPDELRPALTEMDPAPPRQLARRAFGRAVPAFHRQDAETVAGPQAVGLERTRERRRARRRQGRRRRAASRRTPPGGGGRRRPCAGQRRARNRGPLAGHTICQAQGATPAPASGSRCWTMNDWWPTKGELKGEGCAGEGVEDAGQVEDLRSCVVRSKQ